MAPIIFRRRLLKLAAFIGKLKPRKLDMDTVCELRGSEKMDPFRCKSAACAMGWTPAVFPRLMRWKFSNDLGHVRHRSGSSDENAMMDLFGLTDGEVRMLFGPAMRGYTTPEQVARGIEKFVRTGVSPR